MANSRLAASSSHNNSLQSLAAFGLHAAALAASVSPPLVDITSQWKFVLLKQNSLSEARYVKAGQPQTSKVVVKKSPFLIQIGLAPVAGLEPTGPAPDLRQFIFEARLVYDADEQKVRSIVSFSLVTPRRTV